jgi:hypothetical protein
VKSSDEFDKRQYYLYLIQIFKKKGGVPTDRRYGYYVKRVEGLPFPTAEAQARLTNNRKRPGLSGHVMPAPASIPSGGTGFEPQSYAHGQVMQGHQQGNLLKGIDKKIFRNFDCYFCMFPSQLHTFYKVTKWFEIAFFSYIILSKI